jgi:anti-sigma regulatory factor (Ser/Thr protein kinase)
MTQAVYLHRMRIERVLRSDVPSLVSATREMEGLLSEAKVPPEAIYSCALALEEIFTNILRYAYGDAEAHEVRFAARLTDDHVVLEFEDDGRAFDPLAAKPPELDGPPEQRPIGGLGIHLVRKIADALEYERKDGLNRLTVRIAVRPKE